MEDFQMTIFKALQGRNIYQGTVPAAEIARRRKANKTARAQRKTNR